MLGQDRATFSSATAAVARNSLWSAIELLLAADRAVSKAAFESAVGTILWWRKLTEDERVLAVGGAALTAGAVLVMTKSLTAVALFALVALFAALCARRPWLAIYGALIVSPFYFMWNSLLTSGQLGFATKFSPIDVLTGLALFFAGLAVARNGFRVRVDVLDVACLVWLAVSILGLGHGVWEGYEAAFRSSRGPLLWALYFPAVLLVASDARRRYATWRVLLAMAALIGLVDLLAALGLLTRIFPTLPVGTVAGVFVRPNFFGDPALMIPSIVLVLTLLAVGRWSSPQKFQLGLLATLDLAVLMISVTRGFWLGMFAALVVLAVVFAWNRALTWRTLAKALVATLGAAALVEGVVFIWRRISLIGTLVERMQAALTGDPRSVDVRLAEAVAYFDSFVSAPVFGHGYGAPVHFSSIGETTGFAHNQYLFVLQTTGIVGFCALGALLVLVLWRSVAALRSAHALRNTQITPIFLCATLVGFGVTSMISPEFTNVTTVPLLAVATAMVRTEFGERRPREAE